MNFKIGDAYYFVFDVPPVPKPKYSILASEEGAYLHFLLINTAINPMFTSSSLFRPYFIKIDVASHPFLVYDSFVDCNFPKKIIRTDVEAIFSAGEGQHHGPISSDLTQRIIVALKETPALDPEQKKAFIDSLRS
jgi:hypothetical protein